MFAWAVSVWWLCRSWEWCHTPGMWVAAGAAEELELTSFIDSVKRGKTPQRARSLLTWLKLVAYLRRAAEICRMRGGIRTGEGVC